MESRLSTIHVTYSWHAWLLILFLFIYPIVFATRRLRERGIGIAPSASAVPEIFLPTFVSLAASWLSCRHLVFGIRVSGAGIVPRAAGAADAQVPVVMAAGEAIVLGLVVLVLQYRRQTSEQPNVFLLGTIAALSASILFLVVAELAFCVRVIVVEPPASFLVIPVIAALLALVGAAACVILAVRYSRKSVRSLLPATVAVSVSALGGAVAWWYLDAWRHIALGQ
jgi:hypothetical protein